MEDTSDVKCRGWLITLPYKKDDSVYRIKYIMSCLDKYNSYIFQVEQGGKTDYIHYQIYVEHQATIRFSTLKALFPHAHLEARKGSKVQAWEYCSKEDTRKFGPFWKGSKPTEDSSLTKRALYIADIGQGLSDKELLLKYPGIFKKKEVEEIRSILGIDLYSYNRDVKVNYLWGLSRT
ncbi:MAG: hypothetical protein K6E99_03805, partial [Bacilli bacterium]|nr:hypothetical protein [Bacilli bacterium]